MSQAALGRFSPAGPPPVRLDRLMDSPWGVGMYRLRGQLDEAQAMERRLGYR